MDDDQYVYLHFKDYRSGSPWRLADYREKGSFTPAQKEELAGRFGLSPELVDRLSLYVGNTLDVDSLTTLVKVSRRKAVSDAETSLRRAVREARKDEGGKEALAKVLLECSPMFASSKYDAALLQNAQALALDPETDLADLLAAVALVLEHPGPAALPIPADRRDLWDGRRDHIVRSCCFVWYDAGRPLTYTTRADLLPHEQREGPLFELIRAVMTISLASGNLPSDETIRKDIDRFRKYIKRFPEVLVVG